MRIYELPERIADLGINPFDKIRESTPLNFNYQLPESPTITNSYTPVGEDRIAP
jgi:hypothetical protein